MKKWLLRFSITLSSLATAFELFAFYRRIRFEGPYPGAFSAINLGLFAIVILTFLMGIGILVWSFLIPDADEAIQKLLDRSGFFWGAVITFGLLFYESFQDLLFLQAGLKETFYPVVLLENQDFLLWALSISCVNLLTVFALGWLGRRITLPSQKALPVWLISGLVLGGVVTAFGGRGNLPPNAPLPFLHVLIVAIMVSGVIILMSWLSTKLPAAGNLLDRDILALLILWLAAFLLWANVPLQSNYFLDAPRPPNQQFTPTSDSIYYEIQANRLQLGEGFSEDVQHSFYNYFLAGLHWLAGDHYLDIYKLQIAVLALIPFLVYQLTRLMYTRLAGWLAASLVILREYNALQLGDTITVSNVQELMTEPLTLLGVVFFLYLSALWFKEDRDTRGLPFLIGTVVGITALIRVEMLSLALVFGFMTLIVYRKGWRLWLYPVLTMTAGLVLALMPWLVRNYQASGQLTIDKQVIITMAYDSFLSQPAADNAGETVSRLDLISKSIVKLTTRIWTRSTTSFQQSLVYLPSNHFPLGGADNFITIIPEKRQIILFREGVFSDTYLTRYTKSLPYWDAKWEGDLSPRSYLLQGLVIGLVALGISKSWRKNHWLGLLPAAVLVMHVFVYAFLRASGGRYIQVVDWITGMYFSIGLAAVLAGMLKRLPSMGAYLDSSPAPLPRPSVWESRIASGAAAAIILLVASMPIVESLIPPDYDQEYLQDLLEKSDHSLSENLSSDSAVGSRSREILFGEALYPGYYSEEERFGDDRVGKLPDEGRNQVVFYLLGSEDIWVSLPIDGSPQYFPHSAEVVVLGQTVRDSEEDLERKKQPFFKADQIFIIMSLEDNFLGFVPVRCGTQPCQEYTGEN